MNQLPKSSDIVQMVADGAFSSLIEIIQENLKISGQVAPQWFDLLRNAALNFEETLISQSDQETAERIKSGLAEQQAKLRFLETKYTGDQTEFLESVALSGDFQGPFEMQEDATKSSFFDAVRWGYANETELKKIIAQVKDYSMLDYRGFMTNGMLVSYCDEVGLEGAIVETGCWRGGSAAVLAATNLKFGKKRRELRLFDSFEGLPFPDRAKDCELPEIWFENWTVPDMDGRDGELTPCKALTGASVEDVRTIVNQTIGYPCSATHIIPGWFQHTVPDYARNKEPIAILRLDGDLYHSTLGPLRELYPLVVSGGFIVVDDMGYPGPRKAVEEYFAENGIQLFPIKISMGACFFIKP